jgi:hypothetical protein
MSKRKPESAAEDTVATKKSKKVSAVLLLLQLLDRGLNVHACQPEASISA